MKVDLAAAGPPEEWDDLIPQHDTDLLQWATAHEVKRLQALHSDRCFVFARILYDVRRPNRLYTTKVVMSASV